MNQGRAVSELIFAHVLSTLPAGTLIPLYRFGEAIECALHLVSVSGFQGELHYDCKADL